MTGKSRENYNRNYINYVNTFDPPTQHFKTCGRAFLVGHGDRPAEADRSGARNERDHFIFGLSVHEFFLLLTRVTAAAPARSTIAPSTAARVSISPAQPPSAIEKVSMTTISRSVPLTISR